MSLGTLFDQAEEQMDEIGKNLDPTHPAPRDKRLKAAWLACDKLVRLSNVMRNAIAGALIREDSEES